MVDDGRRTDGRRLDGYTISSPCEPSGSGELIKWGMAEFIHVCLIFANKIRPIKVI